VSVYSFLQRRDELTLTKLSPVPPAASKSGIDTGICVSPGSANAGLSGDAAAVR